MAERHMNRNFDCCVKKPREMGTKSGKGRSLSKDAAPTLRATSDAELMDPLCSLEGGTKATVVMEGARDPSWSL